MLIEISADGIGFDSDVVTHQGHGLRNMQMRAEVIGAQISFKNTVSNGSCVVLQFAPAMLIAEKSGF